MRINGVANAASADMNRLRKTKGYSSKRMMPNSAIVLTSTHTTMMPVCPMMKAHEPMNDATRSATRSPVLCFSTWALCQFLMLFASLSRYQRLRSRNSRPALTIGFPS
jgi:hypothetical protein